jgi:hypothetical protein
MAKAARKAAPRRSAAPNLSDRDFEELTGLLEDADSVELKLTVPESDQAAAVASLGLDPLDAQIRQVFFFDTPDLALYKQGVVARARRVQGKGDDSVVKLRPVVPAELPADVRATPGFGVEVDAMPGGFVCSGSMKRALGTKDVRAAVGGKRALRKLFSKDQRAFYASYAPNEIALDELTVLGPIFVLKVKFSPKGLPRKFVAEMWLYPDNSRVLELSTKCAPSEAFGVAVESREFLTKRGVNLSGQQETKTKKALQFFSKRLPADGGSATRAK